MIHKELLVCETICAADVEGLLSMYKTISYVLLCLSV